MENNKYNKRRRSYTEFRKSYSDNKNYFISTDKTTIGQTVFRYIVIAVIFIGIVVASFLITDSLLEISEAPYEHETTTVTETTTQPDYNNQPTVNADDVDEMQNNEMSD